MKFFLKIPIIFNMLSYKNWISQPRLSGIDLDYQPDFFTEDTRGLGKVFEKNLPNRTALP